MPFARRSLCFALGMAAVSGTYCVRSFAQRTPGPEIEHPLRADAVAAPITIQRKPGSVDGVAQRMVNGKTQKIARHAVEAWKVRGGSAALILMLQHSKTAHAHRYSLRYYDLDTGRSRELGTLPFASATLVETQLQDDRWAFALTGSDPSGATLTAVGNDQAIPGSIPRAAALKFDADRSMVHFTQAGQQQSVRVGDLLGTDLRSIFVLQPTSPASPRYLQVFSDGSAYAQLQDGSTRQGRWNSDGHLLTATGINLPSALPLAGLVTARGVPARQRFGVRLAQSLSSRVQHEGDIVHAVSITPVVVAGELLVPAGSTFEGKVTQVNSLGWGFKHETASLTVIWTQATTPDGHPLQLHARTFAVENAQEKVTEKGKIQGIRATGTIGNSAENGILSFVGVDPVAYVFAAAAGPAVLGFAEPEILYPAGTELLLEMTEPLLTDMVYQPSVGPSRMTQAEQDELRSFVKTLPFRTRTKGSNRVSDLTNLVFLGTPAALQRAFSAAGWLPTDDLYASSTFRTVKTLTGNQAYTQAPMSVLLLDERPPVLTLSKTTNTFSSRHHLRVFATGATFDGRGVLTASSTQDIGIAFSRQPKTFIHVIDQHLDNERSKVVNDLLATGCVDHLDMVNRPWVPRDAYNSTGDPLLTDGEAALLTLNACDRPKTTPSMPAPGPNRLLRSTRNTSLSIRNSLYRGNLVYQGIAGAFKLHSYLKESSELAPDAGAWRKTDASGADYKGYGLNPGVQRRLPGSHADAQRPEEMAAIQAARQSHKWDPPRYEFALQGGYLHMRPSYLSAVGILEVSSNPNADAYFAFLADNVGDGWAAGGSVTVNSWSHFSNEFSYFRQQTKYELDHLDATIPTNTNTTLTDADLQSDRIGLVTRQFEYNLLLHPTRPTSRLRPYAAVGPVLQLIALNGAPLTRPAGVYTLGLKNIGLFKAAFDFGNTPPLDGGGVFRIGLQYGGGLKYRVTPRMMVRADWRETWAKNPDIIADSYQDYDPDALDETYDTQIIRVGPEKKFVQERFTLGVAFTF